MHLQLAADGYDFWVDVRVRQFEQCWLAVADICGELEVAVGPTASEALRASLASLGPEAQQAFLAGSP